MDAVTDVQHAMECGERAGESLQALDGKKNPGSDIRLARAGECQLWIFFLQSPLGFRQVHWHATMFH